MENIKKQSSNKNNYDRMVLLIVIPPPPFPKFVIMFTTKFRRTRQLTNLSFAFQMFYKGFQFFSLKERKSFQKCKNSQLKLSCLQKAANQFLEISFVFLEMILFLTGVDVKGHTALSLLVSEVTGKLVELSMC